MCQDERMIEAVNQGKDLYATIASQAFHTTYEECLEHFPKDTPIKQINGNWYYADLSDYDKLADGENDTYKDGKARRKKAKVVLLGLLYGMGPTNMSEQLGCTIEEAKDIMSSVFDAFPKIKELDTELKDFCRKNGYVTTLFGRRRHLPDINLPKYEFDYSKRPNMQEVDKFQFEKKWTQLLNQNFQQRGKLIEDCKKTENVIIKDNGGFIASAERKVLNFQIQGSAAEMTKIAMIKLYKDERLRELGFRQLLTMHDEIIGMCPLANAKECKERFTHIMSTAIADVVKLNITVDPVCSFEWAGEEVPI